METVNELMTLERLLLEIDLRGKFELSLRDAIYLSQYIDEIGEMTAIYFELQNEFFKKYNDTDKLNEYHRKLSADEVDYDTRKVKKFINDVFSKTKSEDLKKIIRQNRYWSYI
jgi:hypothetical protein